MTESRDDAVAALTTTLDDWAAQEYDRGATVGRAAGIAEQQSADQDVITAANNTVAAVQAQIVALQAQLANYLAPQTVEIVDFVQGGQNGLYPFAPAAGPGPALMKYRLKPGSSTKAGLVPANQPGNTNPIYLARTPTGFAGALVGFTLQGTEQGHLYGGLMVCHADHPLLANIKVGGIPGGGHTEPVETFGVNLHASTGVIIDGLEIDGRDENGTPVGASGFATNGCTNILGRNMHVHDHAFGMPTFWQTVGITTVNLWSEHNYIGVNHERCSGCIRHYGLRIDVGINYGQMHITLNNDQMDAPDVEIHLAGWSGGHYGANSPFCVMIGDRYRGAGKQVTLPRIFGPDGTQLRWADAGTTGVPASNIAAAKADPKHWAVRFH